MYWGAPRLSAVPLALPSPEGHPDFSIPLEPHRLITERHRSETAVLGNWYIIVDEQIQSSLVSRVWTVVVKAECLLKIPT